MSHPVASLWAATAAPAPDTPPLAGEHKADIAVIGAGFTGLATALRLAEGGASVIVLNSGGPGFGGSGRNGGQVIPGLKYDPDTLDRLYGEATTDFAGRTAETTLSLIERLRIDCQARRCGWIQASVKRAHLPLLAERMRQWQARGAPARMLGAAEMERRIGGRGFVGGWLDERAGCLHPLSYARGLARAAIAAGARVHGDSEARALKRAGSAWRVELSGGAILAEEVVVATNAYTGPLWPRLEETVVPANSIQVATAKLPAELLGTILPQGNVVSDSRRVMNYFRVGPQGRLMMGGRGPFAEPRGPQDYARIVDALHGFFPQLREVPIAYRWSGRVAMTWDHLPHIHQPFPDLTMAIGYNGRGVALGTSLGLAIGEHLLDRSRPLPLKLSDIKPLPVHGLYPAYASIAVWYYRLRDSLES
ncbi:NAD(P)/FAD-dependent oxidoreductase [Afifella pfennigii]|uniref:NAD(P)/FAD-dependent oxidoreductase n=1 Tax=Afifella pfennigii TaxID=209897 RepID=UPI00047EA250|nr:FAD-binding oxidoreductase [Afifella pfennigii]